MGRTLVQLLANCCAATAWVDGMLARRPFADDDAVLDAAADVAETLSADDWLEAFARPPADWRRRQPAEKICGDESGSRRASKPASLQRDEATLQELAELNREYLRRFGFIFIVFATGKSAMHMLAMLDAHR